jgi:hypothetical protein
MNGIDDYVDKVLVVGPPTAAQQRKDIRENLASVGVQGFQFVDAFAPAEVNPDVLRACGLVADNWKKSASALASYLSHARAWRLAVSEKWQSVMILEDNVRFLDTAPALFRQFMRQVPRGWDAVYLWSRVPVGSGKNNDPKREKLSTNVLQAWNECYGANAIMFSRRALLGILKHAFPVQCGVGGRTNWPSCDWGFCRDMQGFIVDPFPVGVV